MSCPLSFLQKNARNLLNDASDVWKCNQQFAQFWNSRRPPFYILLFSYLFFTLFLWASSCKLSIRFLLFFLFFLWYFQLLFFLPVRLGPLLFVSSYTLSATLLHHPLQPRQFCSFHTISRYVCVCCVCVCVCVLCVCAWCGLLFLAARSNVRRRHAIEQKCFNGIVLSALSLTGCFERSKISLDVVQARLEQCYSKCSYIIRWSLPSVLVWRQYTVWSYRIESLFVEVLV